MLERLRIALRGWLLSGYVAPIQGRHADESIARVQPDAVTSETVTSEELNTGLRGDIGRDSTASDQALIDALTDLAQELQLTCVNLDKEARVIEYAAGWAVEDSDIAPIETAAREIAKRIVATENPVIAIVRSRYRQVAIK